MSLFSTPQRKTSSSLSSSSGNASVTPLLHHSPGLSPIVSYKPMKSTSGMKSTPLLPGIAEEDTNNDTFSTSYNHLTMHSPSVSFDTPLRHHLDKYHHHQQSHHSNTKRDHMEESYLKSMSLLKDEEEDFLIDEFKNSPKKEERNDKEQNEERRNHEESQQNPVFQPYYYHQSLREANRKLIEDVNSRYGILKATTNEKSDFPSSSSKSSKATGDHNNTMNLPRRSVSPLYTARSSSGIVPPHPPSSSAEASHITAPSVTLPLPVSPSPQVFTQQQGGQLPALPIGSFYALLLDGNQQPVLVPVMSSLSPMASHVNSHFASPAFKPTYEQVPIPIEGRYLSRSFSCLIHFSFFPAFR
jgi:hypothetical protein